MKRLAPNLFKRILCSFVFLLTFFAILTTYSQTTIYSESFTSGTGSWTVSSTGANIGAWINGSNTDHSGGATGNYFYSQQYSTNYNSRTFITATSPAIDLTGYTSITLDLDVWYNTENSYDGMKIEYSLNNGSTWSDLGNVGLTNWYNHTDVDGFSNNEDGWCSDSSGWVSRDLSLSTENIGFESATQARLRILFASDNNVQDIGVAFDEILIEGIAAVAGPEINVTGNSSTILDGTTATSTGDFTDFGSVDIAGVNQDNTFVIENPGTTNLILNGATAPYVSITGDAEGNFSLFSDASSPISSSSSSSFTIRFDPVTIGTKTATININSNDTTPASESLYTFNITGEGIVPISCSTSVITLPYSEDFESSAGNWTSGGADANYVTNATWSYSGNNSLEIRSNSGVASSFCSPLFSLNGLDKADFKFFFSADDMVNAETFFIEFSSNSGGSYTTVATFTCNDVSNKDADFESTSSTIFYSKTVTLRSTSPDYAFPTTATGRFRITCNSADTGNLIYIDDVSLTGTTYTTPTLGPGGITTDLDLWLKADQLDGSTLGTDGANVSSWIDNGKGNDASTVITGQEPVYRNSAARNINFNPVVDFENNNSTSSGDMTYLTARDELKGTGGFNSDDIYVVVIPDPTITNSMIPLDTFQSTDPTGSTANEDVTGFGYGSYTNRFVNEYFAYCIGTTSGPGNGYGRGDLSGTTNFNQVSIINTRHNSGNSGVEIFLNANQFGTDTSDAAKFAAINNTRYWLGRSQYWNGSLDGRIAEVITYSSTNGDASATDDRNKIQSYLAIKYGITLGVNGTSQDYVNSAGTTIWDVNTGVPVNDVFNHDIAGIGRDDDSELNQKQSKTVNTADDITIGLTDIAVTNSANSNTISTDESFLVWGNNDGTLAAQPAVNVDMSSGIGGLNTFVDFESFGRTWKVVETGTIETTKVSIPSSMLTPTLPTPGDYLMFISSSPTFSPTAEYRIMSLNGANFETDYNFDGTKYITFGYAPERTFVRSIYFDGIDDYLDAGDPGVSNDNLDLTGSFTISAWIKRDAGAVNQEIVSKRDGSSGYTEGYALKTGTTGTARMLWKNSGGTTQVIQSDAIIPENEWHHISVSYVNNGDASIYVDGIFDKSVALDPPVGNDLSFLIGAADSTNRIGLYEGNIDEVRVWDVALSEDQLRYIMNQEIEENGSMNADGKIIPTNISKNDINSIPWTNLKGYYPMSTYTFTNSKDESGYNNTAALKNLTTVDQQTAPLPYTSSGTTTDWNLNTSWTNGDVQTIPGGVPITGIGQTVDWNIVETNHDLTIDNSLLPSSTLGDNNRSLLALMVKSNEITVDGDTSTGEGNGLTITHYLELDGVIDLEGESQLIQTDRSDLDTSSAGYIERDQQGTANSYTYNYFSSPVSKIDITANNVAFNVEDILRDGTAAPASINFCDGHYCADDVAINTSTSWIYKFLNNDNQYSNWQHIGSNSSSLNVTEGYTMKGVSAASVVSAEQNYVFLGKPNNVLNGDTEIVHTTFPSSLDVNGNPFITLTGNPFPSALDADLFIADNIGSIGGGSDGITGTLYFWEHWGGGSHNTLAYQGGYATYTTAGGVAATSHPNVSQAGAGTKTPGQFIPVGQGFYVIQQHDNDGMGNLSNPVSDDVVFKNSQRVFQKEFGNPESLFLRNSNSTTQSSTNSSKQGIWIGFENSEGYKRQLLAAFIDGATDGVDRGYDGRSSDQLLTDAFFFQHQNTFVIQAYGEFDENREIPFSILIDNVAAGEIQKLNLDRVENISEDIGIFIKDNDSGETHDIRNQTFEFSLEAGTHNTKYSLVFISQSLSVEENELDAGFNVFMNNQVSTIDITKTVEAEIQKVTLFNYLGQTMQIWSENLSNNQLNLPVNKTSTGVYILKIETNNKTISKKIVVE